jgi:calcium/calmodulin-dependent protein kinase I
VREAVGPTGKVAIKIILKKTIKGHEDMVYEELKILQKLHHPHIIKFVDWFEARVCSSIFSCFLPSAVRLIEFHTG